MPLADFTLGVPAGFTGQVGTGPDALVVYQVGGRTLVRRRGDTRAELTPDQQRQRSLLSSLGRRYATLSGSSRVAWEALGARFHRTDRRGRSYSWQGSQAFAAINTHRYLAGAGLTEEAPPYERLPAPRTVSGIEVLEDGRLRIVVEHALGPGSGRWRVRLTPPLPRPWRRALPGDLRLGTVEPAAAYFLSDPSPQGLVMIPRYPPAPGCAVGIEILSLSIGFVPGESVFVRSIQVGAL